MQEMQETVDSVAAAERLIVEVDPEREGLGEATDAAKAAAAAVQTALKASLDCPESADRVASRLVMVLQPQVAAVQVWEVPFSTTVATFPS